MRWARGQSRVLHFWHDGSAKGRGLRARVSCVRRCSFRCAIHVNVHVHLSVREGGEVHVDGQINASVVGLHKEYVD